MLRTPKAAPPAVYLLADNLDTALAAGEDMLKFVLTWQSGGSHDGDELAARRADERAAIDAMRSLEMVLIGRVMTSRDSAHELARSEPHLKSVCKLFVAGTALLADAIEELGDETKSQFHTGDSITAYLRSRGFIAEDAPAPAEAQVLAVTEEFRVLGHVPLGALMDLLATVLDTLEVHYGLYEDDDVDGTGAVLPPANDGSVGAIV